MKKIDIILKNKLVFANFAKAVNFYEKPNNLPMKDFIPNKKKISKKIKTKTTGCFAS